MSGREEAQGREAGHARPEPQQLIVRDVQLHQPVGSQALSQARSGDLSLAVAGVTGRVGKGPCLKQVEILIKCILLLMFECLIKWRIYGARSFTG